METREYITPNAYEYRREIVAGWVVENLRSFEIGGPRGGGRALQCNLRRGGIAGAAQRRGPYVT